jgi:hypothetical protein
MVIGGKQEVIENPFDEPDDIGFNKNKIITESDEINLLKSNDEFLSNYKFNILLILILSLEVLIKLTLNLLNKNINLLNDKLNNILFILMLNYNQAITNYIDDYKDKDNYKIDIPSNFINPFSDTYLNNKADNICYCDHKNKRTNSITLIFSGIKIDYNYYSSS